MNTKEPIPAKGIPSCPGWLLPEAKKEWKRLADLMNQMGVLTEVDMAAFAAYCQSYARYSQAIVVITLKDKDTVEAIDELKKEDKQCIPVSNKIKHACEEQPL